MSDIWYIVWREKFESYSKPQGNGYFERYLDKLGDKWTDNPLHAKRYKSIKDAMNRLGISIRPGQRDMGSFLSDNGSNKRDIKISNLLDERLEFKFEKGRIDTIDSSGKVVINGGIEDIQSYVNKTIELNKKKFEAHNKKYGPTKITPDEEFWAMFT